VGDEKLIIISVTVRGINDHIQWCIAKNGGGYTQTGVAKGLKVPCLFMIAEVRIRCQKNPEVGIPPPQSPPDHIRFYSRCRV